MLPRPRLRLPGTLLIRLQTRTVSNNSKPPPKPQNPDATSRLFSLDNPRAARTSSTGAMHDLMQAYEDAEAREQVAAAGRKDPRILRDIKAGAARREQNEREARISEEYLQQMPREWQEGDVFGPADLSASEMRKWRKKTSRRADVVDLLGINPEDHYSNFSLIADFTTPFGQIKPASMTGLRPKNQRKVAKAVRRAIGLGIHPSIHHHPEVLQMRWPKK